MAAAALVRPSALVLAAWRALPGAQRVFTCHPERSRAYWLERAHRPAQHEMLTLAAWADTLTPHPAAMYQVIDQELPRLEDFISSHVIADSYAGMTTEQVSEVAADPLFSVGIHTADHPFLTKCSTREARDQIQRNKTWLENACNRPCNMVAYPAGDYNRDVIEYTRNLGITYGYAVTPNTNSDSLFEIPRFGIYATSLDLLGLKVHWGIHLRRLKVHVG